MNASVMYDVYQKMHMACSRIYPIALDYIHNTEKEVTFKLPGKLFSKWRNRQC